MIGISTCGDCTSYGTAAVRLCKLHAEAPAMLDALRALVEAWGSGNQEETAMDAVHDILARIDGATVRP